jgi:tetraacyldisaccharide 4'-kinase
MNLNFFLESYFLDVIEGRKKAPFLRPLLAGSSIFYRLAIAMRNLAYDKNWLDSQKAALPVISVGNIVTGGTGKTPLVHKLAEEFSQMAKVAVLTRGFRSEIEKTNQFLRLNGQEEIDVKQCGDEPLLLSRLLPFVDIWVGKNRRKTAEEAKKQGAELLILDDGMQYRSLKRDVEVVILDGKDPFGKGYFLPRGLLRDLPSRLKEADFIVVNHVENEGHFKALQEQIRMFSMAPVVGTQVKPLENQIFQKRVGVFCGIGKPERFFQTLKNMQVDIVSSLVLPDHVSPSQETLKRFADECRIKGIEYLVCTEKDRIKLPSQFELALPLVSIKAVLEITYGRENWEKMVKNIKSLLIKR